MSITILSEHGTRQETFMAHARTQKWWIPDMEGMSHDHVIWKFGDRPICKKCERIAFRHTGYRKTGNSKCEHCGWEGPTITLKEYINSGLFK